MNGDRPRKAERLHPPPNARRIGRLATRARSTRVPETLVEKTVRTGVYVARHRQSESAPGLSRRVQQLVHETLAALANQKWKWMRLILLACVAAGMGASLVLG